ncbi:LON peptidase substrate-binding domain-containing protein [bacterium AH-315-J19]|nr:LON peptidase substrate-binding domain-containing protein [Robiginitomaculum sp.]MBN4058475.1 LON peptidase substrate-binding domain-containing protein [bacterium AH-315-J19]
MGTHLKALAARTNPKTVALFPLTGTVLLPGCDLPLNIFEPRYLNMVDDALKAERLIGMVQTLEDGTQTKIGGLGRIIQFAEMDDGQYMLVLRGLKRFHVLEEIKTATPYAQAKISFASFEADVDIHETDTTPEAMSTNKGERGALTMAMKAYAKTLGVQLDWDSLKQIPLDRLVDQAAMISPFGPEDKQSLLETKTHEDRRRLLIGLMHLYSDSLDGDSDTLQ